MYMYCILHVHDGSESQAPRENKMAAPMGVLAIIQQ